MLFSLRKFLYMLCLILAQFIGNKSIAADYSPRYWLLIQQIMDEHALEFDSLEHASLTENIIIKLNQNGVGVINPVLRLPNGLQLNYGQILLLGGDFFAVAKQPISSCEPSKQITCFDNAFAELAIKGNATDINCQSPYVKAMSILNFYNQVEVDLQAARNAGMKDWEFYQKYGSGFNKKLNRLTCGGSIVSAYLPFGSYLEITENNLDHFVPHALTAYKAGHKAAILQALKAFKQHYHYGNKEKAQEFLQLAYAKNAFALHYLTDALSSGHMRVPRKEIQETLALPKIMALLLADYMHDEDSRKGLNVVNYQGFKWRAYGDGYYLKKEGQRHREIVRQVIQQSTDDIFNAFISGKQPTQYAELELLPDYSKINTANNHAPLFKIIDGQVSLRTSLYDSSVYQWTTFWSGFITLFNLAWGVPQP